MEISKDGICRRISRFKSPTEQLGATRDDVPGTEGSSAWVGCQARLLSRIVDFPPWLERVLLMDFRVQNAERFGCMSWRAGTSFQSPRGDSAGEPRRRERGQLEVSWAFVAGRHGLWDAMAAAGTQTRKPKKINTRQNVEPLHGAPSTPARASDNDGGAVQDSARVGINCSPRCQGARFSTASPVRALRRRFLPSSRHGHTAADPTALGGLGIPKNQPSYPHQSFLSERPGFPGACPLAARSQAGEGATEPTGANMSPRRSGAREVAPPSNPRGS